MQKNCRQCGQTFEINTAELDFLERVSPVVRGVTLLIPPSGYCPDCRMQRRFSYRNERFLHKRTCDLTGKSMISFYRSDASYKVFDKDAWWSDKWDPMQFGRPVDFSRSFFDQIAGLRIAVPRLGMVVTQEEGSAYSPYCVSTKNCYMCSSCVVNEDSYYCYQANDSRNCVDSNNLTKCELCYECLYCYGLFSSAFCKDSENGNGLMFCEDCRSCSDCIGCKNLVNKKNCILNKQVSEAEIKAFRDRLHSYPELVKFRDKFRSFALSLPTRASHITQCENCSGDHLRNCRNAQNCFDCVNLEDCSYLCPIPQGSKDSRDAHYSPSTELIYNCLSTLRGSRMRLSLYAWDCEDILYCDECFSGKNLFGCIGLRNKQYCILNKQYSKEQYETLVPKIIEQMRKDDSWGEFFPVKDSPFAYNETIAQDEFPLTREEVQKRGWRWEDLSEEPPQVTRTIPAAQLPDNMADVPDDIVNWAIESAESGRPFKIIKQELDFYRQMHLPVPRLHPEERYRKRLMLRNPRKLWERNCDNCRKTVKTTYSHERPEKIYCEECYLKAVY